MQGQPASEAPASNLQELLKEIKELKEGLLGDSVTHDNPTFEGPPWRNQQALQSSSGMRLDIPTEDLDDSLEDLVARDSGLRYILSPQAEAQVVQRGQRFENASPQRASSGASGIGRMLGSGLSPPGASDAAFDMTPTPAGPAATPPGAQTAARNAGSSATVSAHVTPMATRDTATAAGATATPVGQHIVTATTTPASGGTSSAVLGKSTGANPPPAAAPRSKIGSRIARPGSATAPAGPTAARTPSASSTTPPIPSPTSRTGSAMQHHIPPLTPTTTAAASAPTAAPRASQDGTPVQPRTARQKVAAAVSAISAMASSGRSTPRAAGRHVPTGGSGSTPASGALPGARSSSGSGGSSNSAPLAAAAAAAASARKRPLQGAPEPQTGTPARKVAVSSGPVAAHSMTSAKSATKPVRPGMPAVPAAASRVPGRASHSTSASLHSGSAAASPPTSPPQTRGAAAVSSAAAVSASAAPFRARAVAPAAVAATTAPTEFQCELSQPSLTLPSVGPAADTLGDESLEDMLADDPLLAASAQAEAAAMITAARDTPVGALQRRTSDELLQPLADAMAGGNGSSDWMNEDADAEMNMLMLGGAGFGSSGGNLRNSAGPETDAGVFEAGAMSAAGTPAASTPATHVRTGLPESTANEILAAASLRVAVEPTPSTVCKVRELLGLDGQQENPEMNSEELWRNIAADANSIFTEQGDRANAGTIATATTTTAVVAAAVAMSRDPSQPSSPAAAAALLPDAVTAGDGVAHVIGMLRAADSATRSTLEAHDRRSLNAAELAAVAGAMQCEILDTDEGFLGDLLAAEAAEAAAVVVAASLAAPGREDETPPAEMEDENPAGSRRLLHQSSSASSLGFDAAVAFEATMISRQLAGGSLAVRPNITTGDAILEGDEVTSAAATPQAATTPAVAGVMGLPPVATEDLPPSASDMVLEDADQDEPAMPAPLPSNDGCLEAAQENMDADGPGASLAAADLTGPAADLVVGLAAAAALAADASEGPAVAIDTTASENSRHVDLARASAAGDALLAADEALAAAAATAFQSRAIDAGAAKAIASDMNEADAAAGLLSLSAGAAPEAVPEVGPAELDAADPFPAGDRVRGTAGSRSLQEAVEPLSAAVPEAVAEEGAVDMDAEGEGRAGDAFGAAAAAGVFPAEDVDMVAWGSDSAEASPAHAANAVSGAVSRGAAAAAVSAPRGLAVPETDLCLPERTEPAATLDLQQAVSEPGNASAVPEPPVRSWMDVELEKCGAEVQEAAEEAVPEDAQLDLAAAAAVSAASVSEAHQRDAEELPGIHGVLETEPAAPEPVPPPLAELTPRRATASEGLSENADMLAECSWATVSATEVCFEADTSPDTRAAAAASTCPVPAKQGEPIMPMDEDGKDGDETKEVIAEVAAAAAAAEFMDASEQAQTASQGAPPEVAAAEPAGEVEVAGEAAPNTVIVAANPVTAESDDAQLQTLLASTNGVAEEEAGAALGSAAAVVAAAGATFAAADQRPQAHEGATASPAAVGVDACARAPQQPDAGTDTLVGQGSAAAAEEVRESESAATPGDVAADAAVASALEDVQLPTAGESLTDAPQLASAAAAPASAALMDDLQQGCVVGDSAVWALEGDNVASLPVAAEVFYVAELLPSAPVARQAEANVACVAAKAVAVSATGHTPRDAEDKAAALDDPSPVAQAAALPALMSAAPRQPASGEGEEAPPVAVDNEVSSSVPAVISTAEDEVQLEDAKPCAAAESAGQAAAIAGLGPGVMGTETDEAAQETYSDAAADMRRMTDDGQDEQMFDAEEDGFEVAQAGTGEMEALVMAQTPEPEPFQTAVGSNAVPASAALASDAAAAVVDTDGAAIADGAVYGATAVADMEMEAAAQAEESQPAVGPASQANGSPVVCSFASQVQGPPFAQPSLEMSGRSNLPTVHSHQLDDADYDDDDDEDEDGVPSDLPHKVPAGAGAALAAAAAAGAAPAASPAQRAAADGDSDMSATTGASVDAATNNVMPSTARKRARLASPGPIAEGVENGGSNDRGSGSGSAASGESTPPDVEAEGEALAPGVVSAEPAGAHVEESLLASAAATAQPRDADVADAAGVACVGRELAALKGDVHTVADVGEHVPDDPPNTNQDADAPEGDGGPAVGAATAGTPIIAAAAAAMAASTLASDPNDDIKAQLPAGSHADEASVGMSTQAASSDAEMADATAAAIADAAASERVQAGLEPSVEAGAAAAALSVRIPEVIAQGPPAESPSTVANPSPKLSASRPAVQGEEQPLLHAWQVLASPVSPGAHDSDNEGGQASRGSLATKTSRRSMLSGGSRLSRVSSRRDEEDAAGPADEDTEQSTSASVAATVAATAESTMGAASASSGAATTMGAAAGEADAPMDVDVPAPSSPAQASATPVAAAGVLAPSLSAAGGAARVSCEDDEQLVPAWKVAAAAAPAAADAAAATADGASAALPVEFSVSAARSSLGVRRSLRSLNASPGGSRLKRSTSQASLATTASAADGAAADAMRDADATAADGAAADNVGTEAPGPVPGAPALAAIKTATTSETIERSADSHTPASTSASPRHDDSEEALAPAWKVMGVPALPGESPDAVAAARGVPLGSQPSFRSPRAGGSRLRRASEPTISDFNLTGQSVDDDGEDGEDAPAAGVGEKPAAGAGQDSRPGATSRAQPGGMVDTGSVLFLGRSRSRSIMDSDAASPSEGRASRFSASESHSADGRAPQLLLRNGSLGRVGALARSGSSLRRSSAVEPSGGSFRGGVSENGGTPVWLSRVSSRRLQTDPVGSVPIPRRSAGGGDPAVDALRPAWQVLPLPASPESPVDSGSVGGGSPTSGAPTAANMLASMRSSSRLSRMSSGIPEDLLAELRLQAHAAVGHLQGSSHGDDGLADMNSSMDDSPTRVRIATGAASGGNSESAATASGDGAGGVVHAWKVLPMRASGHGAAGAAAATEAHAAQTGPSAGGGPASLAPPMQMPMPMQMRSFGGRPTLAGTRGGNQSSRLAVASSHVPALQVSFEPVSPSTRSPRAPPVPAVGEEEEEGVDDEDVATATASGARPPEQTQPAGSADGEGRGAVHAWKLVPPPPPSGSVSGSASAASVGGGTGVATAAGLTTSQDDSTGAGAAAAGTPAATRPPCSLGARPSLKSIASVGGSRLSRINLAVEDYVDDAYSESPAPAAVEDDDDGAGDGGGSGPGSGNPTGHSADRIAPADAANQSAVAAAAAAAAAAIAAADAAEEDDPPSERSSAPAAVGGLPADVLYAAGGRGSPTGSGQLGRASRRSADGAMPDGPIAQALNTRPSMRSSRSSSSSRLSRVSSARDGAGGGEPLGDIREEEGEGLTPPQSSGGAAVGAVAAAGTMTDTTEGPSSEPSPEVDPQAQAVLTAAAAEATLGTHEQPAAGSHPLQVSVPSLSAQLGDAASPVGSGSTTPDSPGSKQVAAAAAAGLAGGAPHRMGRSGSLGSSRLSRVTSQASDAGLADIAEESLDTAVPVQAVAVAAGGVALEDSGRELGAALSHDRASAGRAPPRAPSAGAARIGSPSGSMRGAQAAAPSIPEAKDGDAEDGPLLPAWKVLAPAADARESEAASERSSPSAPPGSTRQPALRVQRSSSLGSSRLRRVTSGLEEQQPAEPEIASALGDEGAGAGDAREGLAPAVVLDGHDGSSASGGAAVGATAAAEAAAASTEAAAASTAASGASTEAAAASTEAAAASTAASGASTEAAAASTAASGAIPAVVPTSQVQSGPAGDGMTTSTLEVNLTLANLPSARFEASSVSHAAAVGRMGSGGFSSFSVPGPQPASDAPSPVPAAQEASTAAARGRTAAQDQQQMLGAGTAAREAEAPPVETPGPRLQVIAAGQPAPAEGKTMPQAPTSAKKNRGLLGCFACFGGSGVTE